MHRLRVLMITVRADHGGGPRQIQLLLRHLSREIEPYIACPDDPPYRSRFEQLIGGDVYSIPHRRFALRFAIGLAAYIRTRDIDVIHTHGKGAGVYGRVASLFTGKPCLHTPHGLHVDGYRPFQRCLYRAYENLSARWVKGIVFVSEDERTASRNFGLWNGLPQWVVSNGVEDVSTEYKESLRRQTRRRLCILESQLVVTTLSRFNRQKNMDEAYAVAGMLPEVLFLWVGEGKEALELQRRAMVDGLSNLRFMGAVDDPLPMLAAADVYLTTSRWEGMPFAVLEAMAMGVPVVASDVTGHRQILGDSKGGILYPLGDPALAVAQLCRLAGSGDLRRQLGAQGRSIQRRQYSASTMAKRISSLYATMVGMDVSGATQGEQP